MNPYAFCENSKRKPFCQKLCAGRTVLFALLCGVALDQYKSDDSIPAREYDSLHDKLLYQQRELLRFIADHQSSSFSYIAVRALLVKKGFIKREIDESNRIILNELLDIRNWSFHNAQSMTVADLEIAKKSILAPLAESIEIKPMLNPVVGEIPTPDEWLNYVIDLLTKVK